MFLCQVNKLSVVEFEGKKPKVHPSVFLAPGSWVIGDVTLDEDVNVWTNAVIRGDDDTVVIGARTTVLEGCLIEAPTSKIWNAMMTIRKLILMPTTAKPMMALSIQPLR